MDGSLAIREYMRHCNDHEHEHITTRAKILAHIILDDPKMRSYSDIGKKAFGPRTGPWISALFCLELFTVR